MKVDVVVRFAPGGPLDALVAVEQSKLTVQTDIARSLERIAKALEADPTAVAFTMQFGPALNKKRG